MPIPQLTSLCLPLLKLSENNPISTKSVLPQIAKEFSLSENELLEFLPSGHSRKIVDRIYWAINYLYHAGLVKRVSRGHYLITNEGKTLLKNPPPVLDLDFLNSYESFQRFKEQRNHKGHSSKSSQNEHITPLELMSIASHQLEHEALDVLKSEIISLTPRAFTSLAVEVILTLRYGSHNIPEESDPEFVNVKNVIIRDPLGLDTIYVRACHRTMDHVGEPEILDFVNSMGALKKGIYITDGDFTQEAVKFAENSEKTINLIDLAQLTQIMNRFNIGLKIHRLMEIKMIDHTFFDELEL